MTTSYNRNEVEKYSLKREELERIFERTDTDLLNAHDARRRAAEWPAQVNELLHLMARAIAEQGQRIATLEQQLGTGRS